MPATPPAPWVIAHRANGFGAPENSLAAFRSLPRDIGVELDVWMTRDSIPVVHHDRVVRTPSGRLLPITALDRNRLPRSIPTLDDVMRALAGQCWINVEIKPTGVNLRALLRRLKRHPVCISSFSFEMLRRVRAALPEADLALLTEHPKRVRDAVHQAKRLACSAIHIPRQRLSSSWLEACAREGLAVRVYTVNDAYGWAECARLGVAGVFTDRPRVALAWRRRQRRPA